jgi:hypothetical protein
MPQPLDSCYLTDEWVDSKTAGGVSEVTLFTPLKPGFIPGEARTYEERLGSVLASVQRRAVANMPTPIGLMPTIHYARWMILRPGQYLQYSGYRAHPVDATDQRHEEADEGRLDINDGLPFGHRSWLYFTSNFDGDMKTYLREFSVNLGKDVDCIWGNCEGYPVGGAADFDAYWDYAKRHQIETHAFYNAYPHLNVPEIHALARFKLAFDEFVAQTRGPNGRTAPGFERAFDDFLVENQSYSVNFPGPGGVYDE